MGMSPVAGELDSTHTRPLTWRQAWNVRPGNQTSWRPSAEFVESALILFYGATNIFLEHLSNEDGKWEARDLEHVSITVLFIGGGLVGIHRYC